MDITSETDERALTIILIIFSISPFADPTGSPYVRVSLPRRD